MLADLAWPAVVGITALAWAIAAAVEWFAWQSEAAWPHRAAPGAPRSGWYPQAPYEHSRDVYVLPAEREEERPAPAPPPRHGPPVAPPPDASPVEQREEEDAPSQADAGADLAAPAEEPEAVDASEPAEEPEPAGEGAGADLGARHPAPPEEPEAVGVSEPAEEPEPPAGSEPEPERKPSGERPPEPHEELANLSASRGRRSWLDGLRRRSVQPEPTDDSGPPAHEPPSEPQHEPPSESQHEPEAEPDERARPPLRAVEPLPPAPAPAKPDLPETAVVRLASRRAAEPREWNLWDLEALAREESRADPSRRDEWSYLFLHLRQFADAQGTLPVEFDGLVRESFGDLLEIHDLV